MIQKVLKQKSLQDLVNSKPIVYIFQIKDKIKKSHNQMSTNSRVVQLNATFDNSNTCKNPISLGYKSCSRCSC